jgi:hypothetical protein
MSPETIISTIILIGILISRVHTCAYNNEMLDEKSIANVGK